MRAGLRIVIASSGASQFQFLNATVTAAGHLPVAYLASRSMRPSTDMEPDLLKAATSLVEAIPPDMDLLLPASPRTLPALLSAYRPDILLVFGFNWRLPPDVLAVPKLGVLNMHPSALPKYRGPSPILWAIRNGDRHLGLTVHRMTERIDSGPVLAQAKDLPLPDTVTSQDVWELIQAAVPDLLNEALDRAVRGDPGAPQDEDHATYAGFPPPEWYTVTWQGSRHSIHNQIRLLRYMRRSETATLEREDETLSVHRTSLTNDGGLRIDCEDGPLWLTCTPTG
jgi:methionyl-tRNA formyltransferase